MFKNYNFTSFKSRLLMVTLLPVLISCTDGQTLDSSRVLRPVSSLDLGTVFTNSPKQFEISLENSSQKEVYATDVQSSCDCAEVEFDFEKLSPGEKGVLTGIVTFGSLMAKGDGKDGNSALNPINRSAVLTLGLKSDKRNWAESIPLNYTVVKCFSVENWAQNKTLPAISIEEGVASLAEGLRTFIVNSAEPLTETEVATDGPLTVMSTPLTNQKFKVEITGLKEDAEAGPFTQEIIFRGKRTDGSAYPSGAFPLYGELTCAVKLFPSTIRIGLNNPTETLTIASSKKFTIVEISAPDGYMAKHPELPVAVENSLDIQIESVEFQPNTNGSSSYFTVVVEIDGEDRPMRIRSKIACSR